MLNFKKNKAHNRIILVGYAERNCIYQERYNVNISMEFTYIGLASFFLRKTDHLNLYINKINKIGCL